MSNHKLNVIREKRTIEATKKNLMGPAGKLGVILQAFGTPIIRQGSGLSDVSFLEDPYQDFADTEYASTASGQYGPVAHRDEILNMSGDFVHQEGLLFDGLSRGVHLEIIYWHVENKLTVSYKGYPVFGEVAGELEGYSPSDEWEQIIDRLYRAAKNRLKQTKKQTDVEFAERIQIKKKAFLEELRLRWGV